MRRKQQELRKNPLALIHKKSGRIVVASMCEVAARNGVTIGSTLAEACALCPGLIYLNYNPEEDRKALEGVARFLIRFSPIVSVEPPDAIFLDITGSERLFKGFNKLQNQITKTLLKFNLPHNIAIAFTPGASWALASFGENKEPSYSTLMSLPVASLRLPKETLDEFKTLGIEQIKQLVALPKKSLASRFGLPPLTRLDQMFGAVDEPLKPVRVYKQIAAKIKFEGTVETLEVLWEAFKYLIDDVNRKLKEEGKGAKKLLLEFIAEHQKTLTREIQLSQVSVDSFTLFNLLRCASESLEANSGFTALSLKVITSQTLSVEQLELLNQESKIIELEFGHLLERLKIRIGSSSLFVPKLVESHIPEKAFSLIDANFALDNKETPLHEQLLNKVRPLHLLPTPLEVRCIAIPSAHEATDLIPISLLYNKQKIEVFKFLGPERISGMWWQGRNKTRNYFDIEDTTGRRFWIFEVAETSKWYLHGIFDC